MPMFTIEDTAGCSCEQIIDELGLTGGQRNNQRKHGCKLDTMETWVDEVATEPCGDCLIANGTPGCENEACEAAVCAVDPFCCNVFWDGICAAEADIICVDGGLCTAAGPVPELLMSVEGGRAYEAEPVSKDPDYQPPTPKE